MAEGCVTQSTPAVADEHARERLLARKVELVRAALDVSQELATVPGLDVLFERVVRLVKERFGYYHAQIFRHEPALGSVVLVCGYGQIGQDMLAAGHSLPMRRGVVGTAAATGLPVLAPDVSSEPGWLPNSHLPKTRGELAVPIRLHEQVLGIIDVQSDVAGALDEDDQMLLEVISGPIAIAIESTLLRQEMEDSLQALSQVQQGAPAREWTSFRERGGLSLNYLYDRVTVRAVDELWETAFARAIQQGSLVAEGSSDDGAGIGVSPFSVHDEFVGLLGIYADPGHPLSQQELDLLQMVSEQVAAALDSARMADATRSALWEAQTLYRISELLSGQMDEASVCASVAHTLVEECGYAAATVYLLDSDRDALVEASQTGVPGTVADRTLPLSDRTRLAVRAVLAERAVGTGAELGPLRVDAGGPDALSLGRVAAVPILAESGPLGAIEVSRRDDVPSLGDRDVRVLEGIAIQTANGIERARLLEQMQEALDAADRATRRYLSDAWDSFLEGHTAESQTYLASPDGVRRNEHAWSVEMQAALERQETVSEVVHSADTHRASVVLAVPLEVRGEVIGVVQLSKEGSEQTWSGQERALVEALVEQLGEAIEGERQFAHTRSTLAQTERMYEASQRISAAADRHEILSIVLEIGSSTAVDQVAVFTFDAPVAQGLPTVQELSQFWDGRDARPLVPVGVRRSVDELPFVYSMSRESSLVVPDVERARQLDPLLKQSLVAAGFQAFAAVPLAVGNEWLGYTLVLSRQVHPFTPGELRVHESVNRQAAIALRSVRLYEEAQRRAHREQLIREITSKMRGTPDLATILNTAVEELGRALGVSRAFVRLDPGHKERETGEETRHRTGDDVSDTGRQG